ncbi:hypothetical protein ES705_13535 [subsurface metagenome]
MKLKDKSIHDLIEKLKNQYQLFIHNQFINYYLLNSDIPTNDWHFYMILSISLDFN